MMLLLSIAIANVTVVDVENSAHRLNQTVIIEGARIVAVDDAPRIRIPKGARIVNGKGKFLIPGLWDMHVHEMPSAPSAEFYIANGVTGVRDMYDDPPKLRELRQAITQHQRIGPRIFVSGQALKETIRTAEQAREAVRRQKADGVDFIKVYNGLPRVAYYAVADECKRSGMPFIGHTPDEVTTTEAAAAGQRSIEHLDAVLLDSSWNTQSLRRSRRFIPDKAVLDSFDPGRASQLFAACVKYGTWHCPTLSIFRSEVLQSDPKDAQNDAKLRLLEPIWMPKTTQKPFRNAALDRAVLKRAMEITAMMFRAGVRLLAGTDTGAPYVLPGFGLHDELELMTEAGIPSPAVLRIATLGAAQFLNREHEMGTIARGKLADLVLLDDDPLKDITNTRRIHAVIADGQLYDRAAIDRMLKTR